MGISRLLDQLALEANKPVDVVMDTIFESLNKDQSSTLRNIAKVNLIEKIQLGKVGELTAEEQQKY